MPNHIYSAKKSDNLFGERHCSGDLVSFRIKVPDVVSVGPSVVLSPSCGLCAIKRACTAASDRYVSVVYTVPLMWALRRGTVGFMIGGIARHRSPQQHNPLVRRFAIFAMLHQPIRNGYFCGLDRKLQNLKLSL